MTNQNESTVEQLTSAVVAYAHDHVSQGGIPFTAFVVDRKGLIVGRGVNRVMEQHDPTAHAEVEALRDACQRLKRPNLSGMTLVASGEPCAMCYLNALYAGIEHVIYAADRHEAAEHGFDYRSSYQLLHGFPQNWMMRVSKCQVDSAIEPFKLYQRKRNFG